MGLKKTCPRTSTIRSGRFRVIDCLMPLWRLLASDNGNVSAIRKIDNRISLEQQGASSFNGDHSQFYLGSDANGFDADRWHIKTHVLIRLGDFDYDRILTRERPAALNRVVGSLECFDCKNCSVFHNHGLPDIETRNLLRDLPAQSDIFLLATRQLRSGNQ